MSSRNSLQPLGSLWRSSEHEFEYLIDDEPPPLIVDREHHLIEASSSSTEPQAT